MAARSIARTPPGDAPNTEPDANSGLGLVATVQSLRFEPGLYCVELSAPSGPVTELGIGLPCLRIEFLPTTPTRPGHGALVNLNQSGWLWEAGVPAYVVVAGGCAGALLTIYRTNDGMPVPGVRITNVPSSLASAAPSQVADDAGFSSVPLSMVAHISGRGDVSAGPDGWLGGPGCFIEGFSLTPAAPFRPGDIEYQAILGNDWNTPWIEGGVFCGSRGLQLPIIGFRARVTNRRAEYEFMYSGRFTGGAASGPHADGEACQAGETPLEALHVVINRRRTSGITD